MAREISGFSNPLIKRVRSLRDKKHRRAEGLFLAEGLRILTEAMESGHLPDMIWHAPESATHPLVQALTRATEANHGEVFVTSPDILSKLSGKDNPGAVIGIYREILTPLTEIDRDSAPLWIVAERLRDPGKLAQCAESAAGEQERGP